MHEDAGQRLRVHTRGVLDSEPGVMPDVAVGLRRLCNAVAAELELLGATVTLMTTPGTETGAAISDGGHRFLDELQFDHGEGPILDAFAAGRPLLEPDLSAALGLWPGFVPAALRAGVGAAFAFPLQLGAVRFGVLMLYADRVRHLDAGEVSQCLIFGDVATELLLDSSVEGAGDRPDPELQGALHIRHEVYQAQGMVMIDLHVGLAEALARMRALAYADGSDLNELAANIIGGRTRMSRDPP